MKTTLKLPDDLMRAVKIRAAQEDRKLQDLIAELIRRGLAQKSDTPGSHQRRVKLPLIQCARGAELDQEMSPERVSEILLEDEARDSLR